MVVPSSVARRPTTLPSSRLIHDRGMRRVKSQDYCVFGLKIRSELALPELFPASGDGDPDVWIDLGSVPNGKDSPIGLTVDGDEAILVVSDVGRFRISGGKAITVQLHPGVAQTN